MAGRTRRRDRPRRIVNSNLAEVESRLDPLTQQAASLSSLGPITYKVKQGDRKRYKSKCNAVDDAESGSEVGRSDAPSFAEESGDETLTEENPFILNQHRFKNITDEDCEGDDERSDTVKQDKGKDKGRVEDPDQSPTPRRPHHLPFTLPIKRPHRIQPLIHYLPQVQAFIPHQGQFVYGDPKQSVQFTEKTPSEHSEASTLSAPIVQGLNDYSLIRISPEKQAEKNAIMRNIGDVFEVQEWDPELPPAPDPDASPERLTVKPEPLTYTTVGSVVKPTDARQFTAPNRIQREGRAGLEAAGRRPMLNTTNPRGQEFFSARNAAQYSSGQSYQNPVTQNFIPEQSPIGKYQSAQYGRHGPVQGQSSTTIYSPPGQATVQNFARDQTSAAGYGQQQFGSRNFGQEHVSRQGYSQERAFTGQNIEGSATNLQQPDNTLRTVTQQSVRKHGITELEKQVLKSVGAPLPVTSVGSRQQDTHSNAGTPFFEEMSPMYEALLAQLQQAKPVERSGNIRRQPIGMSGTSEATTVRPSLATNHDMFMSNSSTNSAARLQDAKMSTVQRLAQFPNPDQERAKARLSELAASKMRGVGNDENSRFSQQQYASGILPYDADLDSLEGNEFEMEGYYQSVDAGNELDYNFRFPNRGGNSTQQQYNSTNTTIRPVVFPRKTPQGYPQPLTAGPPGQRQNTAPSSNKALNSMQQMVANNNRRATGPSNQQYSLPHHPTQVAVAQDTFAPQPADAILPDPKTYPWTQLDKQPRDFTVGAPPRVRQTIGIEQARQYYPRGMDMDTIRSFITTLPMDDAMKYYPQGMDEVTKQWYKEECKWQQWPESDFDALLSGSIPPNEWHRNNYM